MLPLVNIQFQQCASRWYLNSVMLVRIEEHISSDRLIIVGMISSQLYQYSRKAKDFQHPCTIMTNGSMPIRRRCVVPPMWKLWPNIECNPERAHTSLHRSMNQVHDIIYGNMFSCFTLKFKLHCSVWCIVINLHVIPDHPLSTAGTSRVYP